MLTIGHEVRRPGRHWGDAEITIPVPEELETTPGIPMTGREVDWYAREYPLETMNITERASRDWANTLRDLHAEMREIRKEHDKLNSNLIMAARATMEMEPTAESTGEDISQLIKDKARQLGYLEVGITSYDPRYDYKSKRGFTVLPHAICLAYEQDFEPTQTIPSVDAEIVHSSTYRTQAAAGLELGNFIRSLGYKAHVIHSSDATGPVIPMFVAAGLGQLGACGYLLSPHTGNRMRLMMVTTDANVTHDEPVDYGIHAFCQVCQVCVNRCPRARPDARQDLVARNREEQALLQALPAGHGPLPRLRRLHEGLPHPEVRPQERHGALRRHRPGAGQGHPRPRRLQPGRQGLLRPRRTPRLRAWLLRDASRQRTTSGLSSP